MANESLLKKTLKILTGGRGQKDDGLRATDLASLQVALMVAALDGKVLPEEFKTFERLAKKCEGATAERIEKAFDAAIRSAGYVLMQSFRLPAKALASLFADEVFALLPKGFLVGRPRAVRGALTMWLSMAMSDGDYSGIERTCLEALFERLHEQVYANFLETVEAARSRSRVYVSDREMKSSARARAEDFLPIDFLAQTETALAALARTTEATVANDVRTLIG